MNDTPLLPEAEIIPPFPSYEVEGVGTVIAHEGNRWDSENVMKVIKLAVVTNA